MDAEPLTGGDSPVSKQAEKVYQQANAAYNAIIVPANEAHRKAKQIAAAAYNITRENGFVVLQER